jgi:peptidoglycan/LPS O-acetylase OafA/YrhL
LRARPLVYVGSLSYSIYMLHWPILLAWARAGEAGLHALHGLPLVLGYFACVLAISVVTYHAFEVPSRRWARAQVDTRLRRTA